MSEHPYPHLHRVVRERDYYGGDVYVDLGWDEDRMERRLEISWNSWGDYGGVTIALQSADEARTLAAALVELAQRMDVEQAARGW